MFYSERYESSNLFSCVVHNQNLFVIWMRYISLKQIGEQLGDYELAWVDGEVGSKEEDILPLLPHSGLPPPHKAVFVGDLKLADFKQLLASKGVQVSWLLLSLNSLLSSFIKIQPLLFLSCRQNSQVVLFDVMETSP